MGAGHRPSLLLPSLALGQSCRNPRRGRWLRRRPGRCAGLAGAGLAKARAGTGLRRWSLACPLAGVRVPWTICGDQQLQLYPHLASQHSGYGTETQRPDNLSYFGSLLTIQPFTAPLGSVTWAFVSPGVSLAPSWGLWLGKEPGSNPHTLPDKGPGCPPRVMVIYQWVDGNLTTLGAHGCLPPQPLREQIWQPGQAHSLGHSFHQCCCAMRQSLGQAL